ncbi:MAG: class I SAM-dependent methyltransferase [Deltaproteobacteria bacterium]|nr:class I SAM-dependent methyltransferase [Deltaproteobacteria bacterium]
MITIDFNRLSKSDPNHLAGCRILDIGCGTGRHTCAAYRIPKVMAMGVDINLDGVVETKKRLNTHNEIGDHGDGKYGVSVTDIYALPFRDNSFDLVICSEVLEHIQDHKTAVSEAVRVLKPGKTLAVSVPRYLPERICWALSDNYHTARNGHVRIYKKKELVDLLESAGLTRWGFHFAHSLHVPYWWLKCLVGPEREDCRPVNAYHRLLVWDMMKKPWITQFFDKMLNPILGKSMVLYMKKE